MVLAASRSSIMCWHGRKQKQRSQQFSANAPSARLAFPFALVCVCWTYADVMCSATPMQFRFSDDKTLKFVQLYREEACLWNHEHTRLEVREKAYQRIKQAMRLVADPGEAFLTLKGVKMKIKNLRTGYHQELRKLKKNPNHKTTLVWFDAVHEFLSGFLFKAKDKGYEEGEISDDDVPQVSILPVKQLRIKLPRLRAIKSPPVEEDDLVESLESDLESEVEHETQEIKIEMPTMQEAIDIEEPKPALRLMATPEITATALSQRLPTLTRHSARLPQITGINSFAQPAVNHLASFVSNADQLPAQHLPSEDEFHFFGLSVAAQLRSMPLANALAIQSKIQYLLSTERRQIGTNVAV